MTAIAYYPVGTVHMRNLDLLAGSLLGHDFRVLFRTALPWVDETSAAGYGYPYVLDSGHGLPSELLAGDVGALVLPMAAVDPTICDLIEAAYEHGVPVIAIEEVVQIALNQGAINHYLMPVDHLLLASDYEREHMAELGVAAHKMVVTGWPFYSGLTSPPSPERRLAARSNLGLDAGDKVAALCLSRLNDAEDASALETTGVRKQILSTVSRGVSSGYRVIVKLHPAESSERARREIETHLPGAVIVSGAVSIADVLDSADVCLTRGNSQVALEALLRDMPVFAIPCGIATLFDGIGDAFVARDADELGRALAKLAKGSWPDAGPVLARHLPYGPEDALARNAAAVEAVVSGGSPKRSGRDWLELALYRGFLGESGRALALIERRWPDDRPPTAQAASRLLTCDASAQDVRGLIAELDAAYIRPVITGLWIDQLAASDSARTDSDLEVMGGASTFNRHDFVRRDVALGRLYLRAGRLDEAEAIATDLAVQFGSREDVRALAGKLDLQRGRITRRSIGHIGRWAGQGLRRRLRSTAR